MEVMCQSQNTKYIFDDFFTLIKNNKIIYNGNIENVIILHINNNKRFNQILWILYFIDQSMQFTGYFDKENYLEGVHFIENVKSNCQFLGLNRFQAESYAQHQKNQSVANLNNDNPIVTHANNLTVSEHDLKRNKIIKKIQDQKIVIFDITRGLIHDHINKTLPNIKSASVLLHNDEICHYYAKVELEITKNVVVGSIGRSTGLKTRFSHSSIYTGNNIKQNVRADVTDRFKGVFFVTNKRVVFQSNKNGFDIDLKKLSNVTAKLNCVILQSGKDIYKINTSFPLLISEIIYVAAENL